ncbi:MAG: outer membrane homotrimeric porin, partial [Deltaproteobacteria bacterium]|nr:outer membrane homotrimeric porin [Deltaproteobacteria bacterium]
MKRLATLLFAVAFTFAMVAPAGAIEVNVKGSFHFATLFVNSATKNFNEDVSAEHFNVRSRVRTTIDFIADENTKGVLYLSSQTLEWGSAGAGAGLDTTGASLWTREAYLDWSIPDTGLNLKIGLQAAAFPGAVAGTPIYNGEAAGITASYAFNDQVSATLGWLRLANDTGLRHDAADMFLLVVPIKVAGGSITPYGEYTFIGKNADVTPVGPSSNGASIAHAPGLDSGEAWHVGLAVDIPVTADLTIKADAIYGAFDVGGQGQSAESDGFFLAGKVLYNLGFAKAGLIGWYSSGTDDDDDDGGYMPSYVSGMDDNAGFGPSTMGFYGSASPLATTA